ncbi:sconB [Candida jiufengensis]|uniref:sconB n=1 Tax=Candida jiufengensis TaxID=497108 RepID=UPI002224169A|nr:sconB [Candida jiufengensis]KAI5955697.1 sconB [Candida jiufengensis]
MNLQTNCAPDQQVSSSATTNNFIDLINSSTTSPVLRPQQSLNQGQTRSRTPTLLLPPHSLSSSTTKSNLINDKSNTNETSIISRDSTPQLIDTETPSSINQQQQQNTPTQDISVVTPFLVKHISDQNLIPKDNFHKYCYRHNPDVTCNKQTDEVKMKKIQDKLENLPNRDQEAISHVWSIFSAAPVHHRQLILQGLLTQCCFPQLSFISQEVSSLIKIDFISILPQEISLKILCYLDCNSLCNAAQVSRKWKSLADDDRVWHHMCEQHIDRKCPNCGWGLPLMHMKRAREMTEDDIKPIKRNEEAQAEAAAEELRQQQQQQHQNEEEQQPQQSSQPQQASQQPYQQLSQSQQQQQQQQQPAAQSQPEVSEPSRKKQKTDKTSPILKKRPWKSVYSERYKLEKNWRKGIYKLKSFIGHTDGITCLQFNRKYLMTGSYDTTIKIWKIETGECVKTLTGHTKGVRSLVFDNQKLITGGLDSTIKVWNYHTGQCIATYRGHDDAVVSVDFSNKSIVSGSADHTVRVWHVDSRTCYTLRGHTDWVNCVKIHPGSNTIFSASDDTTIRMWDLNTNQCLKIFGGLENNGHIGQVQCVIPLTYKEELIEDQLSADENENEQGNGNGSQQTNNLVSEISTRNLSPSTTNSLPTHILTSSLDNTIKLWDVSTGKCIRTQFGHIEGVWSIASDTFRIISGAHDRLIKVWDLQNGKCLHSFGNSSSVSCVGLSDSRFVSGLENGEVKMFCFD